MPVGAARPGRPTRRGQVRQRFAQTLARDLISPREPVTFGELIIRPEERGARPGRPVYFKVMSTEANQIAAYVVVGKTSEGTEFKAAATRLTRFRAVLEFYDPSLVLHVSQLLPELKIATEDSVLYIGRGTITGVVDSGMTLTSDVELEEAGFVREALALDGRPASPHLAFGAFLSEWQKTYRIMPEFKIVVTDMHMFLRDFARWMDRLELGLQLQTPAASPARVRELLGDISREMIPGFNALHEQFEAMGGGIDPAQRPMYASFVRHQLHTLVMCSPFAHRTYHKPLGYAGDYEMVNMILREPLEGKSFYARVLNNWFLQQWPARAHRNRIQYLTARLRDEALRGERRRRPIRVLNLGCGPAREIEQFLMESSLSDHTDFTLWDFNDETVTRTGRLLEAARQSHARQARIHISKKSVQQVFKDSSRTKLPAGAAPYDYIYCAGLFDYLTDKTCQQLMRIFYDWLAPGGLLVATNVVDCKPFRHMLEFLLDWHLIYRDTAQGRELVPAEALAEDCRIYRDDTEVNLIIEVRKSPHD